MTTILDIGCGSSEDPTTRKAWFPHSTGATIIGVDIKPGKADIVADAHALTMFQGGSVDIITASEVLEHLDSPMQALKEWHRVFKEGGRLYITVPNAHRIMALWASLLRRETYENPEHRQAWHMGLLKQLLRQSGFQVTAAKYFTRSKYQNPLTRSAHSVLSHIFPAIFHENIMVIAVAASPHVVPWCQDCCREPDFYCYDHHRIGQKKVVE